MPELVHLEGPPPIISWCRPTPWRGCLPSPVKLEEDSIFFLVVGKYSTGGVSSGDSCEAAISPQFGSIKELKSVKIVDSRSNEIVDGFKFSSVASSNAIFTKLGTARHRWLEFSSPISRNIPPGLPVNLIFEVNVAKGARLEKDVLSTVIGTTKVTADEKPEHLAMTFPCNQGSECKRRLNKSLSVQNTNKIPEAFFTCVKNSKTDAEVKKCRSLAPQPAERFRPLDFATTGPDDTKYQCDGDGLCWAVCANDTPSSSYGGLAMACPANGPDACDYFCDGGEPDVGYYQC